jgi:signal transduction histidine kinase
MDKPQPTKAPFLRRLLSAISFSQVAWAVGVALAVGLFMSQFFLPYRAPVYGYTLFVAAVVLLAYTAAGECSTTLLPRWALQLLAVVIAAPLGAAMLYKFLKSDHIQHMLWGDSLSVALLIAGVALLLSLVLALGAMYRERDTQASTQALQFALERETLQRQAADARLSVLQAQVEPHFMFNTLANVQALVESGSPRAASVLQSLIAYLRAALPQLQDGAPTLGREQALVRSYLELMQMRMPDRLQFTLNIDPALQALRVPPLTLLTLVENAVRHGIDPAEQGGAINVGAERMADGSVRLWVSDSGRGLDDTQAPGTGLANLRERLAAASGGRARLTLSALEPQGVLAEVVLPDG